MLTAALFLAQVAAPAAPNVPPLPETPAETSAEAAQRDERRGLLQHTTFILPGAQLVTWVPSRESHERATGGGFEVSVAHHYGNGDPVLGALALVERLDRTRIGGGLEFGFDLVGLELCVIRELASSKGGAQWSLQAAPYVSFGFITLSARWLVPITTSEGSPGSGAMLTAGFKVPVRVGP